MSHRENRFLEELPFDPSLREGARNAVHVCLRAEARERVTVIADEESLEISAALAEQFVQADTDYRVFVLEDLTERPMKAMPPAILDELSRSKVSVFAAQAQRGELGARMEMMQVVNGNRLRHGHMVNISKQIMRQGMRADFHEIDRLSGRLIEKTRLARKIHARTPYGTDIEASFSERLRWIKTSGIIGVDKWGNLPGGEIFTSPERVDGVFVVDGVVGDYLCGKYGDLRETPLKIEIENSRVVHLECDNADLLEEFGRYVQTDENSDRVGEFAIGTNLSVTDVIGNILQDEKIPGIHIAFGHPYSEHTGQNWVSTTHIDCVGRCFDIWVDREQVMVNGKFAIA